MPDSRTDELPEFASVLSAALVLPAAAVIDVQANHTATLRLRFGDIVYSAEFSPRDLKPDSVKEGNHVQAEVKGNHLTVQHKDGTRVTGRVFQLQRVIVHPLP